MDEGDGFRYCMEEVENVLGELSEKGEFAFGSFWGRDGSDTETAATHSANFCYESSVLQYHLIEMVSHIIDIQIPLSLIRFESRLIQFDSEYLFSC